MAPAIPSPASHVECENIIINRRRKRLPLPEPCSVTVKPCASVSLRAPPTLDFSLPDDARLTDLQPPGDDGTQDACPSSGGVLTTERSPGARSPVHSQISSHSTPSIPDHGGQLEPVTVHGFLRDMTRTRRKAGRKYGRRKHVATVKLDGYHHSLDRGSLTLAPLTPPSRRLETRNDQHISAYCSVARIQSQRPGPSRQVPHLRRKKRFAKSLAQRLFEADVFSSGTSSRSTGTPDQNFAHISTRRPLQFITSLNLTPSLEGRIYRKKQTPQAGGKARMTSPVSADSEIQAASQANDSISDTLSDGCPAVATSSGKPWSRNRNGTATWKRVQAGASSTAAVQASGKGAFRTRVHRGGGKRSSTQVSHNLFQYVPLPLVRVDVL